MSVFLESYVAKVQFLSFLEGGSVFLKGLLLGEKVLHGLGEVVFVLICRIYPHRSEGLTLPPSKAKMSLKPKCSKWCIFDAGMR